MPTKRAHLGVSLLVLAATALGCGQQVSTAEGPAASSGPAGASDARGESRASLAPWTPSPAAKDEVVYAGFGLRSRPAPATAVVGVSGAAAVSVTKSTDFADRGLLPGSPVVELRTLSDGDVAPDDTGSVATKSLDNRLVWMITYRNSPPDVKGPAGAAIPPQNCDFALAVDAVTLTIVASFQTCRTL